MDLTNAVYDENGLVYIEHWNSNASPYTSPRFNTSIGAVDISLLPQLLSEKVKACCGVNRYKYMLASFNNVSIWKTGHLP